MKALRDRILNESKSIKGNILKVDTFLNHQIDVALMYSIGEEFYNRYKNAGITKILTIEASGIAAAMTAAHFFKVPVVFAKKHKSLNIDSNCYKCKVHSFTKKIDYVVTVSHECISNKDNFLIIDDFLATGNALKGLIEIVNESNATIHGIGIIIEKSFQKGGEELRNKGFRIESLVKIKKIEDATILFEN